MHKSPFSFNALSSDSFRNFGLIPDGSWHINDSAGCVIKQKVKVYVKNQATCYSLLDSVGMPDLQLRKWKRDQCNVFLYFVKGK